MRRADAGGGRRGAILAGVVLLLLIMSILVPLMVLMTQREMKWGVKGAQNMTAFHIAEAGIEKGFRALTTSTGTWYSLVLDGTGIPDFMWDHKFEDVVAGYYAVGISSGPEAYQATIISIGKELKSSEVRTIKAVFAQNNTDMAIQSLSGVTVAGGVQVEWGAIVGNAYMDMGGRTSPQFHSASGLSVDNDPSPENTDDRACQWFAFDPDVPPDPKIDLAFYRSSASAGTCSDPAGVDGSCYYNSAQSWDSFDYTGGGTVMVENNLTVGSPGVNIKGSLIVTGNLATTSGAWGKGSATMAVPQTAWKQYCNNWSHYRSEFDDTAPAEWPANGLSDSYLSPSTRTYTTNPDGKHAVQGFIYVGGAFSTSGGGGNAYIHGNMFTKGSVSVAANSGVTVFYNKDSAQSMRTSRVVLVRVHWQDILRQWPSGL